MNLPDWIDPALDAERMRAADEWAIAEQGVPSLQLMESAGEGIAEAIVAGGPEGRVAVVCGKGNNGGDGLVVARKLAAAGFETEALLLWPAGELSDDARRNLSQLGSGWREVGPESIAAALEGAGVIVDAIFGTGFSGAPREPADAAIEAINAAAGLIVACDIASGVDGSTGEVEGTAVSATRTISLHATKLGQLIAPGKRHCGRLEVAPIGIPAGDPADPDAGSISERVLTTVPGRGAASTKFSSGNVVLVGGSRGMTGAIAMAATAAIRAGAGYAAVATPASLEPLLEVKLTEVMTVGVAERDGALSEEAADQVLERAGSAAFVVVGPGFGRTGGAAELARELAGRVDSPLLVDADGLNALGDGLDSLASRSAPTVLTPHAGELGRLLGVESATVSARRLASAREAARRARAVIVLKGDDTIVTDGERVAVNVLPSPALATAGTGDVLAGIIAALGARGMDPFAAACAGVLAHARAGNAAAAERGTGSVIATDVIDSIPAGLASSSMDGG